MEATVTEGHRLKINPDDNFEVKFKNGYLHILGEKETEIHGGKSRLYLGNGMISRLDMLNNFVEIYYIKLEDLKISMNNFFPFVYHNIKDKLFLSTGIKARESFAGELEIKIEREKSGLIFKSKVVFSRKEYNLIRDYMDGLKLS